MIPALWPEGSYSAQSGRIGSWRRSNAVALDRQKATGMCIVALMTRDSSTSETLRVSPAMAITAADVKVKLLILQVWSRGVTA